MQKLKNRDIWCEFTMGIYGQVNKIKLCPQGIRSVEY